MRSILDFGEDIHIAIMSYLRVADLFVLEVTCKRLRQLLRSSSIFWEYALNRQFGFVIQQPTDKANVRELLRDIMEGALYQLPRDEINKVIGASSVDRQEEHPGNVLRYSRCYHDITRFLELSYNQLLADVILTSCITAQMRCGCGDHRPCYWCSAGSTDALQVENLTFSLTHERAVLVSAFTVTPYQSFFQPEQPTYAPRHVRLRFHMNDAVYFESDLFAVENQYKEQLFSLSSPGLFLGGTAEVQFIHMHQRQTLSADDRFYICISNVRILGTLLPGHLYAPAELARDPSSGAVRVRELHYHPSVDHDDESPPVRGCYQSSSQTRRPLPTTLLRL